MPTDRVSSEPTMIALTSSRVRRVHAERARTDVGLDQLEFIASAQALSFDVERVQKIFEQRPGKILVFASEGRERRLDGRIALFRELLLGSEARVAIDLGGGVRPELFFASFLQVAHQAAGRDHAQEQARDPKEA